MARLIALSVVLALVAIGVAAAFYANDGRVDAEVRQVRCNPLGESTVTVQTRLFGLEQTKPLATSQCYAIREGNFVQYYVRSGRTVVYDREGGRCLWDSQTILC